MVLCGDASTSMYFRRKLPVACIGEAADCHQKGMLQWSRKKNVPFPWAEIASSQSALRAGVLLMDLMLYYFCMYL